MTEQTPPAETVESIIYLATVGEVADSVNPNHTHKGRLQLEEIAASIAGLPIDWLVMGFNKCTFELGKELLAQISPAPKIGYWLMCGTPDVLSMDGTNETITMSDGTKVPRKDVDGIGEMPKEIMWGLVREMKGKVILCVDDRLCRALGIIHRRGRIYRLNPTAMTAEIIA